LKISVAPPRLSNFQGTYQVTFAPIFIIGVPRSGTTLLRVLLDSHSQILALPETPWISGAYGGHGSLRELVLDLADGPFGVVRNVDGVEREHVRAAASGLLDQLFRPALQARGKSKLAFKTPSDIPHLDFLTWLLPHAYYVHITRDGRDVAMSQLAKKGSFFHNLRGYRRLSYANVFRRWMEWEQQVRATLYRDGRRVVHLRYEDLIADPERQLRRVMAFLELPFEAGMLDYARQGHDYPSWEAGSTDVAQRGNISASSVGKWRGARADIEVLHTLMRHDQFLVDIGYGSSNISLDWGQRALIAGFSFLRPAFEASALIQRRLGAALRGGWRGFACATLLALAVLFFAPRELLGQLADDLYEPVFSFAATLSVAIAFIPPLQRRSGYGPAFLRIAEIMLVYLAMLELGQYFTPGRHAALEDLLLNACGALAALIAAAPFFLRTPGRTRSA
jgi:hypothetical protein